VERSQGEYVFEDIGSYINPGTTREGFGIRIAKRWLSLMLIEGEENLSLESRSVVSSAAVPSRAQAQVEVHPEGC
jgi:hypothetical protein